MRDTETKLEKQRQKQLTVNITLMILTLFTLACCIVAWFSSVKQATVNDIELAVERTDIRLLSAVEKIEFPCATRVEDCADAAEFSLCAEEKLYILSGEEPIHVEVECTGAKDLEGAGMLAYVCDNATGDYYTEMMDALTAQMGNKAWTHANLKEALRVVNDRRVGTVGTFTDSDNTTVPCVKVRVIYWVEYPVGGENMDLRELLEQDVYWASVYGGDPRSTSSEYYAKVTFTA